MAFTFGAFVDCDRGFQARCLSDIEDWLDSWFHNIDLLYTISDVHQLYDNHVNDDLEHAIDRWADVTAALSDYIAASSLRR